MNEIFDPNQTLINSINRSLFGVQGIAPDLGPSPEVVVMQQGRSMYEVKGGHACIKVSVEDREHWSETIAHEMGHWACRHVQPRDAEEMYRQELQAWEWAMQKGMKFDHKFVEECIFTHALEFNDPARAVSAMIEGDNLVKSYANNWKPEADGGIPKA
jgi:hypothetical protein